MANALRDSVWIVDTTGAFPFDIAMVKAVKLVAGTDAATLTLKVDGASGTVVYQLAAGANGEAMDDNVPIRTNKGLYATLTGTSPKAYVYLK